MKWYEALPLPRYWNNWKFLWFHLFVKNGLQHFLVSVFIWCYNSQNVLKKRTPVGDYELIFPKNVPHIISHKIVGGIKYLHVVFQEISWRYWIHSIRPLYRIRTLKCWLMLTYRYHQFKLLLNSSDVCKVDILQRWKRAQRKIVDLSNTFLS